MLTVVQDFRKKAAEKPPVNMEMIQQKEKETLVVNEKVKSENIKLKTKGTKNKQTMLTIVQDFPKKKVDLEKVPQSVEMINHNQDINIKPENEKVHPKHQSFMIKGFNLVTDWMYKAFGFN